MVMSPTAHMSEMWSGILGFSSIYIPMVLYKNSDITKTTMTTVGAGIDPDNINTTTNSYPQCMKINTLKIKYIQCDFIGKLWGKWYDM